jgi:hypothetical protein
VGQGRVVLGLFNFFITLEGGSILSPCLDWFSTELVAKPIQ